MRTRSGSGWLATACAAVIVAFAGCAEARTQQPQVHDSTMVEILIELHLAVARAEVTNSIPTGIRDSIFAVYEIDSTAFAETIFYYASEPEKYAQIYGHVLDKLNSERIPLAPDDPIDPTIDADAEPLGSSSRR